MDKSGCQAAETLTAGHTKLAETSSDIATAITSRDEKVHSGDDAVKDAGINSKEGLAEISLELQQSRESIKTAGKEN